MRTVPTAALTAAALGLAVAGLVTAPDALRADWLVLTDGTALEIEGASETRGRMLVFTLPGGKLASLRLDEVDLEASAARTADERRRRAAPSPAPPPPVEKKAVLVLTDADVRHLDPRTIAPQASEADEASEPDRAAGASQRLVVRQWGQDDADGISRVFGVLENRDPNAAAAVKLTVIAKDGGGTEVARSLAGLDVRTLLPGQTTRFEAVLDDAPFYESVDFEFDSVALKSGSGESAPETAPE